MATDTTLPKAGSYSAWGDLITVPAGSTATIRFGTAGLPAQPRFWGWVQRDANGFNVRVAAAQPNKNLVVLQNDGVADAQVYFWAWDLPANID